MIKDYFRVLKMRRVIRKERRYDGRCHNCGHKKECPLWCWGPKIRVYIWIWIKTRFKNKATRKAHSLSFIFDFYKHELKWAGVESWHRY